MWRLYSEYGYVDTFHVTATTMGKNPRPHARAHYWLWLLPNIQICMWNNCSKHTWLISIISSVESIASSKAQKNRLPEEHRYSYIRSHCTACGMRLNACAQHWLHVHFVVGGRHTPNIYFTSYFRSQFIFFIWNKLRKDSTVLFLFHSCRRQCAASFCMNEL